jgi:Caspase domain
MKKLMFLIVLWESVILFGQEATTKSKSIILLPFRYTNIGRLISFSNHDVKDSAVIKFSGNEFILSGKVNKGQEIKSLLINDESIDIENNLTFTQGIHLNNGENQITVKAIDKNNLVSKINFKIVSQSISKRTDYALLFATDNYDSFPTLANPIFDAETIAQELSNNYHFITHLVKNPARDTILAELRLYSSKIYSKEDQLLIFFAGHGNFDNVYKEGYLIAADTKKDDKVKSSYLSHSILRTIVNNIPCNHILLVIDACFSGTFDRRIASRGLGSVEDDKISRSEEWIRQKLSLNTRKYITSGGKDYVSDGIKGHHSPFVRKILEAFRGYGGSDGILTLSELLAHLEGIEPEPRSSEFGDNEPGSSFLFIAK